ncbi:MAG TPA: hypothetical protein VEB19_06170 [Gemmatimonadaceae bacterium]|nr:hypothetical protein [Gemmatimonadaceae bacterium]
MTSDTSPLRGDPRLLRRRLSDEELERLTSAEAMMNASDEASRIWDADSGLPGLLDAEPDDAAT